MFFHRKPETTEEAVALALCNAGTFQLAGRKIIHDYRPFGGDTADINEFPTWLLRKAVQKFVRTHSRLDCAVARARLQNAELGALVTRSTHHLTLSLNGRHSGVEHVISVSVPAPKWKGELSSAIITPNRGLNVWLRTHLVEMFIQEMAWMDIFRSAKARRSA